MNILFLSQSKINLNESGIYRDLINALSARGHRIVVLYADSAAQETGCTEANGIKTIAVSLGICVVPDAKKISVAVLSLIHTAILPTLKTGTENYYKTAYR